MLDESLLDKNRKYLVGVSGGVDSMALLDMLVKKAYNVIVVHYNYHFREDSDLDENLVRSYCQNHHLPFYVRQGDKKEYQKGNMEDNRRTKKMKDITKYQGVIPAFYACYDEKGEISTEGVKALTRHLISKGVKGVYVGGSSGECIYQHVDERKKVLEAVMEEAKGKLTVIVHVGCNNTADSVELAAHAQSVGADAIASIPPIYFHLPEYAIAEYWNAMSAAAPDLDFVIYNIPQLAGTALSMNLLKEMLKNPNVIAVKNSSMPTQDIQMFKAEGIKERGENGFVVFNGPDEQFVSGRAIGADGGIGGTYAVMPELFVKMDQLIRENNIAEAMKIQYKADAIIYKMCEAKGNLYAVMKEILHRMYGLELGSVRLPLAPLAPEDEAVVVEAQKMIEAAIKEL